MCMCVLVLYVEQFTSRSTGGSVEPQIWDVLVRTGLEWRERRMWLVKVYNTHTNNFRSVLQAQIHTYSSKFITLETYSNKTHTLAHCWPGLRPLRKQQLRLMNNPWTLSRQRNQKLLLFVWWVKMMWRVNMQWVIWWLLWLRLFYWLFLLTQIRS